MANYSSIYSSGGSTTIGGIPWTEQTTDFAAVANNGYYVYTDNVVTITLPGTATPNDRIVVWIDGLNNALFTSSAPLKSETLNADFYKAFSENNIILTFTYVDGTVGWNWDDGLNVYFSTVYTGTGNIYQKILYDRTLSEIQLTFAGGVDPLQVTSGNGVSAITTSISSYEVLFDNLYGDNAAYTGIGSTAGVFGEIVLTLAAAQSIKYIWVTPRGDTTTSGSGVIYNPPTYVKLQSSSDNVNYTEIASIQTSSDTQQPKYGPSFSGTILRPSILNKLVIFEE